MGLGYDDSIDFIRTPKEIREYITPEDRVTRDLIASLPYRSLWRSLLDPNGHLIVIGFCGVMYPVMVFEKPRIWNKLGGSVFCYNIVDVDKYMKEVCNKRELDRYENNKGHGYRNSAKRMFEEFAALPVNLEPFIVNRSPIVVFFEHRDIAATWNQRLRDYEFQRVISPYEAWQKIEMFLANLATPEKPIPPQSDIQKVESHGFDKKMSFRKGKDVR